MMKTNDHRFASPARLAHEITQLLELICQGSRRSETVVGIRTIGKQRIRLTLLAEVVDAGANPLQTHGTLNSAASSCAARIATGDASERATSASTNQHKQQLAPDEKVSGPEFKRIQRRRR